MGAKVKRKKIKEIRKRESFIILISDVHIGRVTPNHDWNIIQRKRDKLLKHLVEIHDLQRTIHEFKESYLVFLGDIIDGEGIFPSQAIELEMYVRKQTNCALEFIEPILEWSLHNFKRTNLLGVPGNHGRVTKTAHYLSNFDLSFYDLLKQRYRQEAQEGKIRIGFEEDTQTLKSIEGHTYLVYHGYGIRMYLTCPWYGIQRLLLNLYQYYKGLDVMLLGHFHSFGWMDIGTSICLLNGTFMEKDIWSRDRFGRDGINKLWVFGANPKHPVTWHYDIQLDGK